MRMDKQFIAYLGPFLVAHFAIRSPSVLYTGTKFRQMLRAGDEIPEWFAFKSVVEVLRKQVQSESS